ncbi:MAG: YlxR family protein [Pseudonocardiaceae bacterium]|nr:MAG: YlxR family protein [Pseudonocardiaceae bacterium]
MGDALHSQPARCQGPTPDRPPAGTGARTGSDPVRTCVGCRTKAQACGLLRVAVVDGVLTPDPRRRLPGRGAWLHLDPECLDRAERRSAFPRALRVPGPLDTAAVRSHLQAHGARETPALDTPGSKVDPS